MGPRRPERYRSVLHGTSVCGEWDKNGSQQCFEAIESVFRIQTEPVNLDMLCPHNTPWIETLN